MSATENSVAASRELIKEHYNQHVEEGVSTREALARRRDGPAAPLKQYHNEIKRRLIYRFAYGAEALLDYACGRGGDLHKWKSAQVRYVKGLDLSPKEIEEARRRYGELLQRDRGCSMQAQFEQTDHLGLELWQEERQYDAATCMFALHYFFERESSLMMLMQTVAANLKPGGYFFGTVPDGKRIKAHLVKAAGEVSQGHLMLKQEWQGKEAPFGSPYIMEISDTVVQGHEGFSEGSHEYLVFEKVLLSVAKKYGLHPVVNFEDPALDALFEEGDVGKPLKHFSPQYPVDADASLAIASKLYMAFVLQKVDSPQAVHAPPLPPPDKPSRGYNSQQQHNQQQQRQQQSPTREQRLAGSSSRPPLQQQQQQQPDNAMAWRGGGNRKRNADWQLPYQARHLPPQEMPSAFLNVRNEKHLQQREVKGRFVIQPPPLPFQCGPVQFDQYGHPVYPQLPNGAWISSYYDELNYHSQLQQQQQQMAAAAAGHGVPPPQPPPMQQQQQQPYGGMGPAGGGSVGNRQQQPPQQQQQSGVPPLQAPTYPGPPTAAQLARAADAGGSSAAAAAAADAAPADAGARGRGRGRGRKAAAAAAAAAEGEAGAGELASPTRGRGRGSRGGRTAGSKRARESSDGGAAAAAAAAEDASGDADAAAAAVDADQHEAKQPALQQRAAACKAAGAAAAAAGSRAGGGPLGRSAIPDPLGYKSAAAVDVSQLAPELLEQLIAMAPKYLEQ